jgi:hypothetical protein
MVHLSYGHQSPKWFLTQTIEFLDGDGFERLSKHDPMTGDPFNHKIVMISPKDIGGRIIDVARSPITI